MEELLAQKRTLNYTKCKFCIIKGSVLRVF